MAKGKTAAADLLTVEEWLAMYTDRKPPFDPEYLSRPVNQVPRRLLKPATVWMRGLGIDA